MTNIGKEAKEILHFQKHSGLTMLNTKAAMFLFFYNTHFLCKIKIFIEHHSSDKVFPVFDIFSQFKHRFQLVKQPNDHKTP